MIDNLIKQGLDHNTKQISEVLFPEGKCQYILKKSFGSGCDVEKGCMEGCELKCLNTGEDKDFLVEKLTNGLKDISCVGMDSRECPIGLGFRLDKKRNKIIKRESGVLQQLSRSLTKLPTIF